MALFDLLLTHVSPPTLARLELLDEAARPTAAARAIEDYIAASRGEAGMVRRGHAHGPYHRISAGAAAC
jgi:hypothetical protein